MLFRIKAQILPSLDIICLMHLHKDRRLLVMVPNYRIYTEQISKRRKKLLGNITRKRLQHVTVRAIDKKVSSFCEFNLLRRRNINSIANTRTPWAVV